MTPKLDSIETLQVYRLALEHGIDTAIARFESDTGLLVESIDVIHTTNTSEGGGKGHTSTRSHVRAEPIRI